MELGLRIEEAVSEKSLLSFLSVRPCQAADQLAELFSAQQDLYKVNKVGNFTPAEANSP